jgi:hypothetical protein
MLIRAVSVPEKKAEKTRSRARRPSSDPIGTSFNQAAVDTMSDWSVV